jgi:plastocyanin
MKKLILLLMAITSLTINVNATKHSILISGFTYSPALLTANVGDTITISASNNHPLLQVSKATWVAKGTDPLAGGIPLSTKNYTFTLNKADTIYYICVAHVEFGMQGKIVVAQTSGVVPVQTENLSVSVFPNPVSTTGKIKISAFGNNPPTVMIYNISGQLEKDLTKSIIDLNGDYYGEFDASAITNGNHFVLVSDGKKKVVKRFEVIR